MIAKDLLSQYKDCERIERRLREEIFTEKQMLTDLKSSSSRIRKRTDSGMIILENRLNLWADRIPKLEEKKQKILDLIASIPGTEGEILYRRYVKCEKWEQISEELFYSWGYTHTLHNRGLQLLQERLDHFLCSSFD